MGIELKFRIVGGRHDQGPDFTQMVEDGHGQEGPFLRVRPRTQLVKEDQGPVGHLIQDADNISHVGTKGGQVLLNGLLISDVGIDGIKNAQAAPRLSRDMET